MRIDDSEMALVNEAGELFDPRARVWRRATQRQSPSVGPGAGPGSPELSSVTEAVRWLQTVSGRPCPVPVGVVGPREPNAEQVKTAHALGAGLASLGLIVLCGGRQGVMEAASRGAAEEGGLIIGLLPDQEAEEANAHVTVALATGIGVARNAIIARAAFCLVAVGGGYGTISECAFALQFEKPTFSLAGGPDLSGVIQLSTVEQAVEGVAYSLLRLPYRQEN